MKMVNDDLVLFSKSEVFLNEKERIFMMIPFEPRNPNDSEIEGKMLIGTMLNGFYLFDGLTLKPFPTEVDEYLKKNIATHGIRLTSGDFALATRFGGLIIMSPQGRLKSIFNKTSGLQDDNAKYVMEDKQGNLWLCLDNGISKIEYASPFFIYDGRSGLPGSVLSVVRQQGDLYAGTTQTLYVQESQSKTFQPILGIYNSCWCLLPVEDSVLAATSDGIFQVANKNIIKRITGDQAFVLLRSRRHPLRIWCGTNRGLVALLLKNGQWVEENRIENIHKEIRSIAEDQNGNVWLGISGGTVYKVDCSLNDSSPVVTGYDKSHGLPAGEVYVAMAAGSALFATGKGFFRFDEKTGKFIPDKFLGKAFMGGAKPVFRMIEDKNKTIWFHSESKNYQAIPGPGATFTIEANPFRRIPIAQVNTIYPDLDMKSMWFATFDGLIRYDKTFKKNYRQDFQTLIRKVFTNDKLIFGGCKNKTGQVANDLFTFIEYKDRNLRFEFSALFYEDEAETQYRCFLEGYDHGWSAWNKAPRINYTNLAPGRYNFRVQARNVYQDNGSEDTFQYKIEPPWYRTWWAYILYGIGIFMSIFLFIQWRASQLRYEKQKLEQIVKERTKEIQEKNLQLETQTLKLQDQSEKLKEMDKVKSNFFANISHEFRTPLTLIMSPLEQMLSNSRDKKQKSELNVMLRSSQHLLTLINQLLDLSRFDSGKTKLQAACRDIIPFLKGIVASFQVLAQQKQLGLEFQPEVGDMPLYFDAPKMEESMYNLLINAV
ncbi:MAG TPA: histidine kinase dimerization/phospho-acceptor domain-containing protein, partial [Candidatus Kapabacteria bacterium]|nr:histidine kinase dimerization/phospho-acceptor domain-containing protein [Candidatus Kapabacteria bacterium]